MEYRFVFSKIEELLFISSTTYGNDAVLNNAAGSVLQKLALHNKDFIVLKDKYHSFFAECIKHGWITESGEINGSFTVVDNKSHLKRAQIELTRFCNLKCLYCYSESGSHQRTKFLPEKVFEIIDELETLGCVWVDFTGGEPFLFRGWYDVFKYVNDKSILLSIHTNGTIIDEEIIEKLSHLRVKQIQISLDSHLPEIHDKVRGKRGAFAKTINSIRTLKQIGISVKVSLAAHKLNQQTYRDSVTWIRNELGTEVLLDRIIKAGYELDSETGLEISEYYNLIAPMLSNRTFASKLCSNEPLQSSGLIEPSCGIAHSFVYITADGEVALCPTMTSRENSIFAGPSVYRETLTDIWYESAYFNSYRYLNCKNINICPKSQECTGGCRSNAYIESKKIDSPDIISCNIHKNETLQFVEFNYP